MWLDETQIWIMTPKLTIQAKVNQNHNIVQFYLYTLDITCKITVPVVVKMKLSCSSCRPAVQAFCGVVTWRYVTWSGGLSGGVDHQEKVHHARQACKKGKGNEKGKEAC